MRLLFDEVCGQGVVYLKERFTKLAKPFENLTCIAGRTGIRRRRGGLGMIALCRPGKCHTLFLFRWLRFTGGRVACLHAAQPRVGMFHGQGHAYPSLRP